MRVVPSAVAMRPADWKDEIRRAMAEMPPTFLVERDNPYLEGDWHIEVAVGRLVATVSFWPPGRLECMIFEPRRDAEPLVIDRDVESAASAAQVFAEAIASADHSDAR